MFKNKLKNISKKEGKKGGHMTKIKKIDPPYFLFFLIQNMILKIKKYNNQLKNPKIKNKQKLNGVLYGEKNEEKKTVTKGRVKKSF